MPHGIVTGSIDRSAGLSVPADHPSLHDDAARFPLSGVVVDCDERTIRLLSPGHIDGPVFIGEGWSLEA